MLQRVSRQSIRRPAFQFLDSSSTLDVYDEGKDFLIDAEDQEIVIQLPDGLTKSYRVDFYKVSLGTVLTIKAGPYDKFAGSSTINRKLVSPVINDYSSVSISYVPENASWYVVGGQGLFLTQ